MSLEHFRCTLASFILVGTFSQVQDLTDRSSYGKFMVSEILLQTVINTSLHILSGECENVSVMSGHTGAVVQLKFSPDGDTIYTASTDKTVCT